LIERSIEIWPGSSRAGHSVEVMLRVYAKCIDGQRDIVNQRIEDALNP
jgi:hypothetical protein